MPRDRRILLAVLVFGVASSVLHYTDNTIRFDQYPQDEPKLITQWLIPVAWIVFTVFAVLAYRWYREGRYNAAAAALAFYSISGLIGPVHYTSGSLDEFDAAQHVLIALDSLAGVAVVVAAVLVWRQGRRGEGHVDRYRQ